MPRWQEADEVQGSAARPKWADAPEATTNPTFMDKAKRQVGLAGRELVQGALALPGLLADIPAAAGNIPFQAYDYLRPPSQSELITGQKERSFRFPSQNEAIARRLTEWGFPKPETTSEKVAGFGVETLAGAAAGGPMTEAAMGRLGYSSATPEILNPRNMQRAYGSTSTRPNIANPSLEEARASYSGTPANVDELGYQVQSLPYDEAVQILRENRIPMSGAQRSGNMAYRMTESATKNHPYTADRFVDFKERQLQEFTRAVLQRIGVNSRRATPEVMNAAKSRLGQMFDDVAKSGVTLSDDVSGKIIAELRDAQGVLKPDEFNLIWQNMQRIAAQSAGNEGQVSGQVYNSVRRALRALSRRPDVGQVASQLDDLLLDALQQSNPRLASSLETARSQYRSMKVIEGAIDKGLSGYISPSRLANAWQTMRNRAASVYGQGGDQQLIRLARAAKDIVPDVLPDSGTVPRGLMQAPLRAIATAPIYRTAQNINLMQPGARLLPQQAPASTIGGLAPVIDETLRRRRLSADMLRER